MNPEQWLSLKWNGGSTMSDRWLNQSKIIHAATNFQITHRPLHPVLIDSIVMVKKAAAITNEKSGKLD